MSRFTARRFTAGERSGGGLLAGSGGPAGSPPNIATCLSAISGGGQSGSRGRSSGTAGHSTGASGRTVTGITSRAAG